MGFNSTNAKIHNGERNNDRLHKKRAVESERTKLRRGYFVHLKWHFLLGLFQSARRGKKKKGIRGKRRKKAKAIKKKLPISPAIRTDNPIAEIGGIGACVELGG